ncbi:PRD domain-containing protein [Actinomycetaceae bacterium L2_0104]
MKVLRVFNNNVVMADDTQRGVVIVTGRGVGFSRKPGDDIDSNKVVQTFVPDAHNDIGYLSTYLVDVPPEYIEIAREIHSLAEQELKTSLPQSVIITLADHIAFAVKRVRSGVEMGHPLKAEVSHLYAKEYRVARKSLEIIREHSGAPIADDEAVAVTMHLVNALQFQTGDLSKTFEMTEIFSQIFDILSSTFGRRFETDSLNAARFITHLRYFFVRAYADKQLQDQPQRLTTTIRDAFPEAFQAAQLVQALLELRLDVPITEDERAYLTLHIARLASE